MENKTKNILITLAAIGGISYLISLAVKNRKKANIASKQGNSNLVDDMLDKMGKATTAQFTLINNTSMPQDISLFNAFDLKPSNRNIQINPSMGFFNKTLLNEPKKINKIKVMVNSGAFAQAQATQVMTKYCKDANGDSSTENYYPMVGINQFQSNMTEIQPNNLILDGTCVLNYTVQPNTTVTLIFDYQTKTK